MNIIGAHHWAQRLNNGDYQLLDPFYGKPLCPDQVPRSIGEIAIYQDGLDYLKGNADRISLTAGYVRHTASTDLGEISDNGGGWYEEKVAGASFYAYEGIGHRSRNKRTDEALRVVSAPVRSHDDFEAMAARLSGPDGVIDSFRVRCLRAADIISRNSFCFDVASDRSFVESSLLEAHDWLRDQPDTIENRVVGLGLHNIREWMMVVNTGNDLRQMPIGVGRDPISGFITVGGFHKDLTRKFATVNITVEEDLTVFPQGVPAQITPYVTGIVSAELADKLSLDALTTSRA